MLPRNAPIHQAADVSGAQKATARIGHTETLQGERLGMLIRLHIHLDSDKEDNRTYSQWLEVATAATQKGQSLKAHNYSSITS